MAIKYILQDRTTNENWAISIDDSQIQYVVTTEANQTEPTLRDVTITSDYYKLFISDGEMGIESISITQDEIIQFNDLTADILWRLRVYDGQLSYEESTSLFRLKSLVEQIRVKSVDSQNRLSSISDQDRVIMVSSQNRLSSISDQDRVFTVSSQNRLSSILEQDRVKVVGVSG